MSAAKHILKQLKMGTTEILVLAILTQGDRYGYEISKEVFKRSKGFFEFKQGFLYPALNRMERASLIDSYWQKSESGGPSRKYYRLTPAGRKRLQASTEAWALFSKEFNRMLRVAKKSR
jgi:DNA-binding PadR family transcriptional regulator